MTSFSLNQMFSRSVHKRNPSGLLDGGGGGEREHDSLTTRRRRPTMTTTNWTLSRLLRWSVATLIVSVVLFFYRYQVHIELQLFNRNWIQETILPVVASTSTCFLPSHLSLTSYNQSLASSPSHVDLHPGINLPLGRDCYDFASTLPLHPTKEMIPFLPKHTTFHLYWRNDLLPLGTRQIHLLHSILATQDPSTTSVIFWTNAPNPDRQVSTLPILKPLLELYRDRLKVRRVDKRELAKGTPMEGNDLLEMADQQAWVDGDLVRILVLYDKGGIWIDFDTILTGRDLRVLTEHEWVTQWDCYDKIYQPLNGAMMHFYESSPYLCEMLHVMSTSPPPSKNSIDWGSRLYYKVFRSLLESGIRPFKVLPYCFTDGVSCRLDNRLPDPFGEPKAEKRWGKGRWEDVKSKVENVWAVHLHNRWEKGFPPGGYIDEMILKPVMDKVERYQA